MRRMAAKKNVLGGTKMKKKFLAICCAFALACTAAGCGGNTEQEHTHDTKQEQQEDAANSGYDPREGASEEALEMLDALEALPEDVTQEVAAEKGFFTIADGAVVSGQDAWDNFLAASEVGEEASVVVCQYSQFDGAILDSVLHRADGIYEVVSDTTRDGYERENGIYQRVQQFAALKVFEDFTLQEGGESYTVCVLTNETELDADTFRTYWTEMSTEAHQAYMLFVI